MSRQRLSGELGPETRALLAALVAARGGSDDLEAIEEVNALLESWWAGLGFAVSRHPVEGRADLLVAEAQVGPEADDDGRVVVTIVGHSDTVWPAAFEPEWQLAENPADGTMSGPGIGDMKAGLVIAGLAAQAVARDCRAPGLVRLVVVPDEEVGSVGSRALLERLAADTDLCLGLEAGKPPDEFVAARGAVGAMRVSAAGVPAHVTEPGGVNALEALLPLAAFAASLSRPGLLVSVCRLVAGEARQITAADGWFEVDLRAERAADLLEAVEAVRAAAAGLDHPAEITVTGGMTRPALAPERSEAPLALLAEIDAARAPDSPAPVGIVERGGSDASFFADAGVPTLDGFGAICWDNCARGERILTASIPDRAERMAALATAWIEGGRRRGGR